MIASRISSFMAALLRTAGEQMAKRGSLSIVPKFQCRVSFIDSAGIEHAVEVEADLLYEAVGIALSRFQNSPDGFLNIAPHYDYTVKVRPPATTHKISFAEFTKWLNDPHGLPPIRQLRAQIRQLLSARPITVSGMGIKLEDDASQ